jgi:hypothetical protein
MHHTARKIVLITLIQIWDLPGTAGIGVRMNSVGIHFTSSLIIYLRLSLLVL